MNPALLNTALALVAGFAGAIIAISIAGPSIRGEIVAPSSCDDLIARSLTIVDDAGRTRLQAAGAPQGFTLSLYDDDDLPRIILGVLDNAGPAITDNAGTPRIAAACGQLGPSIFVNDATGESALSITQLDLGGGSRGFNVHNPNGGLSSFGMLSTSAAAPNLFILNDADRIVFSALSNVR